MFTRAQSQRGDTLIEVMVAFSIIVVTMTALFSLFFQSLNLVIDAQGRNKAYVLAMEGINIATFQRTLGCDFSKTVTDADILAGSTYVIKGDLYDSTNDGGNIALDNATDIVKYTGAIEPTRIEEYSGFRRTLKFSIPNTSWFPTDAAHSFDWADKYVLITIKIEWSDRNGPVTPYETSTVMLRKWKDI